MNDLDKNFTDVIPISLLFNEIVKDPKNIADIANRIRKFYLGNKKVWIFSRDNIIDVISQKKIIPAENYFSRYTQTAGF